MTDSIPKVLVPVHGTPLSDRIVADLLSAGIERITFVVGYLSQKIIEHYRSHPHFDKFDFVEQSSLDGTGGAVRLVAPRIKTDFLVVFGDSLFAPTSIRKVIESETRNSIGVVTVADPERYGIVDVDRMGKVIDVEEKPPNPKTNLAIAGIYKFANPSLRYFDDLKLSKRGEYEIPDAIRGMIKDQVLVSATEIPGMVDVGTLTQLDELERKSVLF